MKTCNIDLDQVRPSLQHPLKQFLNHVSSYIEPLPPRFYRQQTEYDDPRIYYDNYQADTLLFLMIALTTITNFSVTLLYLTFHFNTNITHTNITVF